MGGAMIEILLFRRMVAPVLLQVLFWAGIGGTFYGAWVLWQLGNWAWWMPLIFGTIATRVVFEFAMIAFRSYERLVSIEEMMRRERAR